jgi:hypothetical protein
MNLKNMSVAEHVDVITTIGVIGGIYLGIKKSYGVGKTALCAIIFGVAANYIGTSYYKYQNSKE